MINRLFVTRKEKKKSIEVVSRELGISQSSLRKYEACYRNPNDHLKVKMAEYYGTTVQDLFFFDNTD